MARAAGKKHYYTLGLIGPDGQPIPGAEWHFPGVTGILDDVLAKPALIHWYYSKGVNGIVTLLEQGKVLPHSAKSLRGMLNKAGLSPYSVRNQAAGKGTATHSVFELLCRGEEVERTPQTEGIIQWWEARGLTPDDVLATEVPLMSFKHRYGGTLDLVYRDPETNRVVLCDLKTGSGVYWSMFLQGEAYREAWEEHGGEPVDLVTVLHAPVGGGFKECYSRDITFDLFKKVLDLYYALPDNWRPDDIEEEDEQDGEGVQTA